MGIVNLVRVVVGCLTYEIEIATGISLYYYMYYYLRVGCILEENDTSMTL